MPTTNSPKGSAIPVRPTPQMRQQLDELSAAGFGNQTDVIRTAIDRMYVQEIREMTSTPKYFIPGNSVHAITNERVGDIGKIVEYDGEVYTVEFADNPTSRDQYYEGEGYTANTKREAEKVSRHYRSN
jgi:hypothetical protein